MITRRNFLAASLAGSVVVSSAKESIADSTVASKTRYIAAYDTESPTCLKACEKIVEMHKRHSMPTTFFVVGKMLEANPNEYKKLLNDPLFEVASHTYSHKMLKDHPLAAQAFRSIKNAKKSAKGRI